MSAPVIVRASSKHSATVIFLHGLGDTGHGWSSAMSSLSLPYIKFICPTAPAMPVTLNSGYKMPSWFDLKSLEMNEVEDIDGIRKARDSIHQLIEQEVKEGIHYDRIMIGGFSQGGALALYSLLTSKQPIAGAVALSCWLPLRNEFPSKMNCSPHVPVLQCHGESDPVVPFEYGKLTHQVLKNFLSNVQFKSYKFLSHSSNDEEMEEVKKFISKCLPPA